MEYLKPFIIVWCIGFLIGCLTVFMLWYSKSEEAKMNWYGIWYKCGTDVRLYSHVKEANSALALLHDENPVYRDWCDNGPEFSIEIKQLKE